MKRLSWMFCLAGFALLQGPALLSTPPALQKQYRIFVAPISDFAPDNDEGPTRFEYVTNFDRKECQGVVSTSREDLADFTAWFEFEGRHFVLLWDAQGNLVFSRGGVRSSGNIVKDVCEAVRERGPRTRN